MASAKAAGIPLSLGYDTITEGNTMQLTADVLVASGGKGSKLVVVQEFSKKEPKPEGIEISLTGAMRTGLDQTELGG